MTPSLRREIAEAISTLETLKSLAEAHGRVAEVGRLKGKAEGLRLGLAAAEEDARTIIPTEYTRADGRVTARRNHRDHTWALVCIRGHAWFWNRQAASWDTCTTEGFNHLADAYTYTRDEALDLLPRLRHIDD